MMGHVMTLANSIIGVGILAMPFCFQKCGVILSILLLLISNLTARISCHYLIKSAMLTRRKSFEFLGFHAFGFSGKLMVELCIIGYLIGTCIAYFVVVGDLGPQITAKVFNLAESDRLRTWVMVVVTFICIIPLGLLKNVDSLSAVCTASIGFYVCLVVKVIAESKGHILAGDWVQNVEFWKPSGVLQCLPIYSMALACQMQLFEVFEVVPNVSIEKMNYIVKSATGICTVVYIFVGFFGYVAFCTQTFSGNILMNFSPSFVSDAIKMGFVLSVAFSFPLVIFPCRASIYSLLYRRGHDSTGYIPEGRFKSITVAIVLTSLCLGLLIPSIELVIGLVGSTIGVAICIMFPASCFMKVSKKDSTEKTLAQFVLVAGFCLMILGTYANLNAIDEKRSGPSIANEGIFAAPVVIEKIDKSVNLSTDKNNNPNVKIKNVENVAPPIDIEIVNKPPDKIMEITGLKKKIQNEIENNIKLAAQARQKTKEVKVIKLPVVKVDPNNISAPVVKDANPVENQFPKPPQPLVIVVPLGNQTSSGINKDAIQKEEEVVAEEAQKSNVDQIKETKSELKKAKELLEQKVDELNEELAKKNKETQEIMNQKLEAIEEKIEKIEKNVQNKNPVVESNIAPVEDAKSNAIEAKVVPLVNESGDKTVDQLKSENPKIQGGQPKANLEVPLHPGPVLGVLTGTVQNKQKPEVIGAMPPAADQVYEPDSYKVGEVMNKAQVDNAVKTIQLPLPLLLESALQKSKNKNQVLPTPQYPEVPIGPKLSQNDQKAAIAVSSEKPKESVAEKEAIDKERDNIESIRRDILGVVTTKEDSTEPPKLVPLVREKREAGNEICLNMEATTLEDCLHKIVSKDLIANNVASDIRIQSFGRDLKSVDEKR